MNRTNCEQEECQLTKATLGSPTADAAEAVVRPARRRRATARKASVAAASTTAIEKADIVQTLPEEMAPDSGAAFVKMYRRIVSVALRGWHWVQARRQWQLASRRLALCETVSLGEKRFLAIVQVDGQQFLVGGAAGSVSMLAPLSGQEVEFAGILRQRRKTRRAGQ